jgi:hypothetical protein
MMCDSGTPFCINNAMACTAELPAKWQGMSALKQWYENKDYLKKLMRPSQQLGLMRKLWIDFH